MLAPPTSPSPDQLEALIKEARERQRRRRLAAASFTAVTAALALGVYALVGGGQLGNLAQPPADGGRATGPLCRASQLSIVADFQGATQSMLGGATLENTGSAPCSLPVKAPTVDIVWRGRALRIRQRAASAPAGWHRARVLAPGAKALVLLQWWNQWWCGGPTARRPSTRYGPRFVLHFRDGLVVSALGDGLISPSCPNPGASALDVSRPLAGP